MTELTLFPDDSSAGMDVGKLHACTGSTCQVCHLDDPAAAGMSLSMVGQVALEWTQRADDWRSCQQPGAVISSDDLVAAVGLPAGALSRHGNNAMGALFSTWARRGYITRCGYIQSKRKSSHGTTISQWRVNHG